MITRAAGSRLWSRGPWFDRLTTNGAMGLPFILSLSKDRRPAPTPPFVLSLSKDERDKARAHLGLLARASTLIAHQAGLA